MRNAIGQAILVARQVGTAQALPKGTLRQACGIAWRRGGNIGLVILQMID
jgi:hypothetical protein